MSLSKRQEGIVRQTLEHAVVAVRTIPNSALAKFLPRLKDAQVLLLQELKEWERKQDGSQAYTAHTKRSALAQMEAAIQEIESLGPAMSSTLLTSGVQASHAGLTAMEQQLNALNAMFEGAVVPVSFDRAAILSEGNRLLAKKYPVSAKRYAGAIREDVKRHLSVGTLQQRTITQMANAMYAEIPGVFDKARSNAMRLVRTEVMNSYNDAHYQGLIEANEEDSDVRMRWDASYDFRRCVQCADLDGKIVDVDKDFEASWTTSSGKPRSALHRRPPAHPNCRCVLVPWIDEWPDTDWNTEAPDDGVAPDASYVFGKGAHKVPQSILDTEAKQLKESKAKAFKDSMAKQAQAKIAEQKAKAEAVAKELKAKAFKEAMAKQAQEKIAKEKAKAAAVAKEIAAAKKKAAELAEKIAKEKAAKLEAAKKKAADLAAKKKAATALAKAKKAAEVAAKKAAALAVKKAEEEAKKAALKKAKLSAAAKKGAATKKANKLKAEAEAAKSAKKAEAAKKAAATKAANKAKKAEELKLQEANESKYSVKALKAKSNFMSSKLKDLELTVKELEAKPITSSTKAKITKAKKSAKALAQKKSVTDKVLKAKELEATTPPKEWNEGKVAGLKKFVKEGQSYQQKMNGGSYYPTGDEINKAYELWGEGKKPPGFKADLVGKGPQGSHAKKPAAPVKVAKDVPPDGKYDDGNARISPAETKVLNRMKREHNKAMKALPPNMRDAVQHYTGSGYTPMNRSLRGLEEPSEYTKRAIKNLDHTYKHASLKEDHVSYRGVRFGPNFRPPAVGSLWEEPGYSSTSVEKDSSFSGNGHFTIEVPKGTPAVYVSGISSVGTGERELLIGRGARFRVVSKETRMVAGSPKHFYTLRVESTAITRDE